jgi:hypothetical protein
VGGPGVLRTRIILGRTTRGGFLVTEVAPLLRGNDRKVLYIGDHELRGPADQIEANTRRYLEEHTGSVFDDATWTRVALTEHQVNGNKRLLALKITKRDNRYKPAREYEAVECEAVGQVELERTLRRQLDHMLPEPLADVLDREERQRAEVRRLFEEGGAERRPLQRRRTSVRLARLAVGQPHEWHLVRPRGRQGRRRARSDNAPKAGL